MCMRLGANCVWQCTFKISHEPEVFLPCSNFSLITVKQPFFLNHSPKGRASKAEGSAVHSHLNFSLNMIPAELDIGALPPPFLIWVRQLQKKMHAQARRLSPRHSAKTFPKVNLINLTFKGLLLPFWQNRVTSCALECGRAAGPPQGYVLFYVACSASRRHPCHLGAHWITTFVHNLDDERLCFLKGIRRSGRKKRYLHVYAGNILIA